MNSTGIFHPRISLIRWAVCLLGWVTWLSPVRSQDAYPILVYVAPSTEEKPVLDGELNDAVWSVAPPTSGFSLFGKSEPYGVQSSFRILYDAEFLYIGLHFDEPHVTRMIPFYYARDDHSVFSSDAFEIFIDPDHSHERYFQFAGNVANSLYDGERENPAWNSSSIVRGFMGRDFWSVEIAIPWKDLGVTPTPGKVIGLNVCRNRVEGDGKVYLNWSRVETGFHDPARFGHLVLSGAPEILNTLSDEFRKGSRNGPLLFQGIAGRTEDDYRALAAADLARFREELDAFAGSVSSSPQPEVKRLLSGKLDTYRNEMAEWEVGASDCRDNEKYVKLTLRMQALRNQMKAALAETRLSVLLDEI
ncbi:MAG: sugar-binding protein [Kiritimatiellia bacterium]|nr:sugar-binding protein [Kiritimatiellia bacterium]